MINPIEVKASENGYDSVYLCIDDLCIDDLKKLICPQDEDILNNLKNYTIKFHCTADGGFEGIEIGLHGKMFSRLQQYIKCNWSPYIVQHAVIDINIFQKWAHSLYKYIKTENLDIQSKYDKKFYDLESKYDKKFYDLESKYDKKIRELESKYNDLFKNTVLLKQDLYIKNEKIRELELKVYYLELQTDKKVTYDYESIKQKNKNINTELRRIYKLTKFKY